MLSATPASRPAFTDRSWHRRLVRFWASACDFPFSDLIFSTSCVGGSACRGVLIRDPVMGAKRRVIPAYLGVQGVLEDTTLAFSFLIFGQGSLCTEGCVTIVGGVSSAVRHRAVVSELKRKRQRVKTIQLCMCTQTSFHHCLIRDIPQFQSCPLPYYSGSNSHSTALFACC